MKGFLIHFYHKNISRIDEHLLAHWTKKLSEKVFFCIRISHEIYLCRHICNSVLLSVKISILLNEMVFTREMQINSLVSSKLHKGEKSDIWASIAPTYKSTCYKVINNTLSLYCFYDIYSFNKSKCITEVAVLYRDLYLTPSSVMHEYYICFYMRSKLKI